MTIPTSIPMPRMRAQPRAPLHHRLLDGRQLRRRDSLVPRLGKQLCRRLHFLPVGCAYGGEGVTEGEGLD